MTTLAQFARRAKTRHAYEDMIMVRYTVDDEDYDTWVSGEEAEQRIESARREKQIRAVSQMDWDEIKAAIEEIPDRLRDEGRRGVKDRLADGIEDAIGGNIIGDSLADNVRGRDSLLSPGEENKRRWMAKLQDTEFRLQILELAWLDLRSSLPEDDSDDEYDDWV
jgi:hypothetical protein